MSRDYKKLDVFHLAHQVALSVYRLTARLARSEEFGLQTQLRRAAVSIPSNIAEGASRRGPGEYARFLDVALGSATEVDYLLRLIADLGVLSGADLESCRNHTQHLVRALQNLRTAVSRFTRS